MWLQEVITPAMQMQDRMLFVHDVLGALRDQKSLRTFSAESDIAEAEAAVLWMFVHISNRGLLPSNAIATLIKANAQEFMRIGYEYAELLRQDPKAKLPVYVIALIERKLVKAPGMSHFYDVYKCQTVEEVPQTFEGITYNLAIPVQLEWQRLHKGKDIHETTAARAFQESANARNNSAGDGDGSAGSGDAGMGPRDDITRTGRAARDAAIRTVFQQTYGRSRDSDD